MVLDAVDRQILTILRKDARTPFTVIGKDLGMSDATVHVRVNKMLNEGVIKRYTVVVDEDLVGTRAQVRGFVLLNVNPGSLEDAVNHLVKNERVSAIYEIHGPNDLLVEVDATTLTTMRDLLLQIRGIPNVTTSELITVYKIWKEQDA